MDRALHGILVAAVRQLGKIPGEANQSTPFHMQNGAPLRSLIESMIDERVMLVASEEIQEVMGKLKRRLKEWEVWDPATFGGFGPPPEDPPLMHPAGSQEPPAWNGRSWATLTSLRNVDASCEAEITSYFNELGEEQQ
jgi:hypothetical protein